MAFSPAQARAIHAAENDKKKGGLPGLPKLPGMAKLPKLGSAIKTPNIGAKGARRRYYGEIKL